MGLMKGTPGKPEISDLCSISNYAPATNYGHPKSNRRHPTSFDPEMSRQPDGMMHTYELYNHLGGDFEEFFTFTPIWGNGPI